MNKFSKEKLNKHNMTTNKRNQNRTGQLSTHNIFTERCYASTVLAMGLCLSVSVSVCVRLSQVGVLLKRLNVGSHKQHHTGTLVFWCQRSPRNSIGVTPYEGAECRWGGQNRRLSTNNRLYLEKGKR